LLFQAVRVSSTEQRDWFHLVGNRVDVHVWAADARPPPLAGRRAYPSQLRASERWVQEAIERSGVLERLPGLELFLVGPDYSASHHALLSGRTPASVSSAPSSAFSSSSSTAAAPPPPRLFKELFLLREERAVHVYDLIEHGRRWYRSLAWSSDAAVSLHNLKPRTNKTRGDGRVVLSMGDPCRAVQPAASLVISRRLTAALGKQTYVPARLVHGLVPSALLASYDLWQNDDGSLTGDARVSGTLGGDAMRTRLLIRLSSTDDDARALVQR